MKKCKLQLIILISLAIAQFGAFLNFRFSLAIAINFCVLKTFFLKTVFLKTFFISETERGDNDTNPLSIDSHNSSPFENGSYLPFSKDFATFSLAIAIWRKSNGHFSEILWKNSSCNLLFWFHLLFLNLEHFSIFQFSLAIAINFFILKTFFLKTFS